MSDVEDRIEDPFILSSNMSSLPHHEPNTQKRKMSHSDHIDDGTPPIHVDPDPNNTPSDSEDIKVAYNGPATIYVVMLRVSNESSARPMPQAAFFDRNKALAFATRILLQWCEAHYDDYLWKGPASLRAGLVERYAGYHAQTGQQLAVADVIRVCVFDAQDTEVILKKEDANEEKDDEEAKGNDEAGNAEPQEQLEEESEEISEDISKHLESNAIGSMTDDRTAATSTHSTQTQGQGFGRLLPAKVLSDQRLTIGQKPLSLIQLKLRNKKLTSVSVYCYKWCKARD